MAPADVEVWLTDFVETAPSELSSSISSDVVKYATGPCRNPVDVVRDAEHIQELWLKIGRNCGRISSRMKEHLQRVAGSHCFHSLLCTLLTSVLVISVHTTYYPLSHLQPSTPLTLPI